MLTDNFHTKVAKERKALIASGRRAPPISILLTTDCADYADIFRLLKNFAGRAACAAFAAQFFGNLSRTDKWPSVVKMYESTPSAEKH